MPTSQDPGNQDAEAGESTPLLGAETDSAPVSYPLGGAVAPPPADAPPPPPSADDNKEADVTTPQSSSNKLNDTDEENASQSQSTKSGKSGKSHRKKKKGGDASSVRSSKSTKKLKKKKKEGPQKSICHLLFDIVRYMAIIASCMMFTLQIVPLIYFGHESTWLQISVRSYLAIFCLSFILNEVHLPFLERFSFSHNNWILRGFLYSFIGLIGMEQDIAIKVADIAHASPVSSVLGPSYGTLFAKLYMSITTYAMIGVGILYFVLGLLCMQKWYVRLEKDYREKVREYRRKKKEEKKFKKQLEDQKKYEKDRQEGRGEWYDDIV